MESNLRLSADVGSSPLTADYPNVKRLFLSIISRGDVEREVLENIDFLFTNVLRTPVC